MSTDDRDNEHDDPTPLPKPMFDEVDPTPLPKPAVDEMAAASESEPESDSDSVSDSESDSRSPEPGGPPHAEPEPDSSATPAPATDIDPVVLPAAATSAPAAAVTTAPARRRNLFARMWLGWTWFFDRREDAAATALVRITLALVILYDQFQIWIHDLVVPLYAIAPDGYGEDYKGWSFKYFGPHTPHMAYVLWGIVVVSAVCLLTGTLTRLACATYVVVASQLAYLAPQGDRGIDMMIRIFIGILFFSHCNARFSVDAWVRRVILKRPIPTLVPAWPRYLLAAQLVWIYFSGGINKSGSEWGPFGGFLALANTLSDPHFARFQPTLVPTLLPLTRVATAVTVIFEITSPIFVALYYFSEAKPQRGRVGRLSNYLNKHHARWLWMAIGSSFHFGIAMFMRLGIFPFGMLAIYPALLLPDELRRLGYFIRRKQPPAADIQTAPVEKLPYPYAE